MHANTMHSQTLSRVSNLYILYSTLRYELWKLLYSTVESSIYIYLYTLLTPTLLFYRGVTFLDSTIRQVYNLGNGGFPVHHDPVDGIWAKHEK